MADNKEKFAIHITAVDGFTKIIQGVRGQLSGFRESFDKAGKAMSALKRDSGWSAFSSELSTAKDNASSMASSIASLISPGALIGGIGLAGIGKVSTEFGEYSRSLTLTARRTSFTVDQLQSLGAMAKMAGMDTAALNEEMIQLDQTFRNAVFQDPNMLALLKSLGINPIIGHSANAPYQIEESSMELFKQLADKYQKDTGPGSDGGIRRGIENVMEKLGKTNLIPLLAQGRSGIETYEHMQNSFGFRETEDERKNGEKLYLAQATTVTALDNLTKSIGAGLAPSLTKLNDRFSLWLNGQNGREVGAALGGGIDFLGNHVDAIKYIAIGAAILRVAPAFSVLALNGIRLAVVLGTLLVSFEAVGVALIALIGYLAYVNRPFEWINKDTFKGLARLVADNNPFSSTTNPNGYSGIGPEFIQNQLDPERQSPIASIFAAAIGPQLQGLFPITSAVANSLKLEVNIKGAPPGTTAGIISSAGRAVSNAKINIDTTGLH